MPSYQNIAILILAAGASSRMGRTKQLLPWNDTTLLGNAIQNAAASNAGCVVVVLGANAKLIRKRIIQKNYPSNKIQIIENTEWQSGLGSSIACGTKSLLKTHPHTEGILVMLADQPLIDTTYLNAMLTAFEKNGNNFEGSNGVATAYKNKAGVPALFPESYFEELAALHDDFGAKEIINRPKASFLVLEPGDKIRDIDTKSDYKNLINR